MLNTTSILTSYMLYFNYFSLMETINDRLLQIVDTYFDGNRAAFARAVGIAKNSTSNYLGKERKSDPSSSIVANIVRVTDINAKWLLTGEGEMNIYRKEDVNEKLLLLCKQLVENHEKSEEVISQLKSMIKHLE